MKRTTIVLSAAALGGLSATAIAGGVQDDPKTGWPLILGYQPTSLTEASPARATTPRAILMSSGPVTCNQGNTLNDNGIPNGTNGYSNATTMAFGARRTLLDDFEVPNGETWTITDFHHRSVWALPESVPPLGTGLVIAIRSDAAGAPDTVIIPEAAATGYSEVVTGNQWFSRAEVVSWSTFDPIELDAGRYWFEISVVGPENNFWLTADQIDSECWVNYEDLGGFSSGTTQFGVASDINWCIGGTSEVGPANQFGLKHSPEGAALLDAGGDTLTVSNIGSSGKDGVSIDLGDFAGGYAGHRDAPALNTTSEVMALGTVGGTPDTGLGTARVVVGDPLSHFSLILDGTDATTFTVNFYLDDALVGSIPGNASGTQVGLTADPIPPANYVVERRGANVAYLIEFDSSILILNGIGDVDEIELVPDQDTADIESLNGAKITVSDVAGNDVVLDDGALIMFGQRHRRNGGARMITEIPTGGPQLRVSNIGSSGDDGINVGLDNVDAVDVALAGQRLNAAGNITNLTATGCFDDAAGTDIGRASIILGGGFIVLQADFAAISASNMVTVEVYDDGAFVASAARPGGGNTAFLFGADGNPFPLATGVGHGDITGDSGGLYYRFPDNIDVRTSIGKASRIGIGDEVRVIAADPDGTISGVDGLNFNTNSGTIFVVGETVTGGGSACGSGGEECDPKFGDANGDGCVSFADILEILGTWGNVGDPGIPGDANCDGEVSFADILLVLGTWGQGNCP